ncbi:hypothetical protein F5148DRAFT_1289545 [Russula earlei]|uniref:Uncharacterized protein n=1 Tax=Russula earlei TaxID=71964 RepID=A0ACC0TXH6_9AGAM|nr:hypothetical protein F5148DRAFT_1289545 [Russula earlei]
MKAAGFTADVINTLSLDSLKKIVKYHITNGAVSDTALSNASVCIKQNCLLDSVFFNASFGYRRYIHSLYVKKYGGSLSINGWFVNNNSGAPVKASNGYIYTINLVLQPPAQRVWDIVKSRPELNYYVAAINIIDSIYYTKNFYAVALMATDSALFNQVVFDGYSGDGSFNTSPKSVIPTVFAPTNTAFINAGFPDIASIRTKIVGSMKTNVSLPSPYTYLTHDVPSASAPIYSIGSNGTIIIGYGTYYLPFDSMLKMHYLFPVDQSGGSGTSFSTLIPYTDLTNNPSINNGVFNISTINTNIRGANSSITPYQLQFSSLGGLLQIQWNPAGTNNITVNTDANQLTRNTNFWALNGVVYECDRLFYNQ